MSPRRWAAPFAVTIAVLACGGPPPSLSAAPPVGHYAIFEKATVVDQEGFAQPVDVVSFLVPKGWRVESGVRWKPDYGCPENMAEVWARATAPDGVTAFEIFPSYTWGWYDDPMARQLQAQSDLQSGARSCEQAPAVGAADFIVGRLIPTRRAGASPVATESQPDIAQAFYQASAGDLEAARQMNVPLDLRVDAARVRASSPGVEEWLSAVIWAFTTVNVSPTAMMQGRTGTMQVHTMSAGYLFDTRAPAGQLDADAPMFAAIVASVHVNQQWYAAVGKAVDGMRQAQIRGAADRARIWSQTADEISDMQRQTWENRSAAEDRIADEWSQERRGVETWQDGSTPVEVSAGYTHAWTDGDQVMVTDDPSFDPRSVSGNWRELQRAP